MRILFFGALLFSGFHTGFGQLGVSSGSSNDYFQVEGMRGFLAAHTQGMQELYRHTYGVQFHFQRSMERNRIHSKIFQKSMYYGTTVNVQSLGSEAAGYSVGLGFSLFIPAGPKQKTRYTVGMGGGYLSAPYSLENPKNIAIGSYINGMMRLGLQRDIWISKSPNYSHSIQLNAGMTHFSNGNWSQPNLGVNIPYASFSYRYKLPVSEKQQGKIALHQEKLRSLHTSYEKNKIVNIQQRNWGIIGGVRVGRRQIEIDQERNFTVGVLEMLVERQYTATEIGNNKNLRSYSAHPHFGVTAFLDRTYQYHKPNPLPAYDFAKTTELAIIIGNRYLFGRVGVLTDVGVYLYRPSDAKRRYFQALGLSYMVNQKWILSTRLKVHLSSADYIEWGLGYRL